MTGTNQYESRFGLRVPAPDPAARKDLDLRPRRVQQWLSHLPLADAQESCRHLHALLHAANRKPLEASARFKLAEVLHDTVGLVARALIRGVNHRGFPLTGKALQQADACTALQREFADTYKLVIASSMSGTRGDRKLLAAAIQHATQQLSRLLLDHYSMYAPAPDGLWLDLHRLFLIAEDHDLLTPAASSRRAPPGARIAELYRQSLLISLSNPYRLRKGEMGRILTLASALAHKLILTPRPTERTAFQIRTEQDRPPFARAHEHDTGGVRYIDLSAVVTALDEDASEHEPDPHLRQRLLDLWRRPPRRGFNRIHQAADVRVGLGLNTAHYLLEREAPPIPEIPEETHPALGVFPPVESLTESETHITLDTDWYNDGNERFYPTVARQKRSTAYPMPGASLPEPEYRDFLWRTLDVSARGCCLQWDSAKPSPAKVGEVVILREQAAGSWSIGVVRWMQFDRDRGLRLGVEILAPQVAAVVARSADARPADSHSDTALQLSALNAAGKPASLILSPKDHAVGEQLVVIDQGQPRRVRLSAELERNGAFSHFVYEPLERNPADAAAEP